ncbi:MAG TPA: hypothetical protein VEU30_08680 [Thermoanaerobaculia bacterium]|nr:hypothetical protein [Thermoanaerobaculia bacterium]
MSRSFRTEKPRFVAQRHLERTADGEVVLPRIVARRPAPGDGHPLTASMLRAVMRREIPPEYLHGLSRIELRPRTDGSIGVPFGCYLRDEKAILLYSLPEAWVWDEPPDDHVIQGMQRFFAYIGHDAPRVRVRWPDPVALSMWYFIEVFAHELGHHYSHRYRGRRGGAKSRRHDEFLAELHSTRFYERLVRKLRK